MFIGGGEDDNDVDNDVDNDDNDDNDNNDDNENLYKYIKPPVLSRTNTTGKQFSLMRDITEDQNISDLLLHKDVIERLDENELLTATTVATTHKNKEYWRGVEIEMENEK
jgi:hypothetical protein